MTATFSIDEQIAEVQREIGLRKRLYPRWVAMQKMTQVKADHGIEVMMAALATLERVQRDAKPSDLLSQPLSQDNGADRP